MSWRDGEPEPWGIAAMREHDWRDYTAIATLAAGAGLVAVVSTVAPPVRLLVMTGLRLTLAGACALATMIAPPILAQILGYAAHGFALLALIGLAAHIEGAALGPLADRITRGRPP